MREKGKKDGTTKWLGISPWLIIGAMVILTPIFIFMTLDNINKQRQHTIRVFLEKGDILIRSFEAGVRTGMGGRQPDFFHLQKLLMETAQQPDIDFITVIDAKGKILADSDPSAVGEYYGNDLELERISRSAKIEWRQVPNPDGVDTFEVFRGFSPARRYDEARRGNKVKEGKTDKEPPSHEVIIIGLNMGPIEAARKVAARNTVLTAGLLLIIGISGIITLFLAQGYRSAKTSLARLRVFSDSLVENMPIGLVALDNEEKIISFNQTAEKILRHLPPNIVGEKGATILPGPFKNIITELETEEGIIEREIDCPVADGETIPLEVIATQQREENGNFLGYVILFRDLTEVRHLKKEIARSQRLASLGNLAAGVAHEIRNPLSSIKGFATYFKERYRDNPEDGETADIMVQEVERLNRVISQLLEFARPVTVEKKPSSLQTLIRQTLKIIEAQAGEKNITIHSDLAPDIPDILIDSDKIKQVLLNLYLNALGVMKAGDSLKIKLSRGDGGNVTITVADTGPGIGKKDLAHIFDPYFTTRPGGTGLGLSIVHKIIEAHDGEISVKSSPGEGTDVSILLPLAGVRRMNL